MKLMISQPMNGKTNEQIEAERKELVEKLEAEGHEVLNTVFGDFPTDNASPIFYLAKSIEFIDQADGLVFMQGWDRARGCRIEYEVACSYGKFIKIL